MMSIAFWMECIGYAISLLAVISDKLSSNLNEVK